MPCLSCLESTMGVILSSSLIRLLSCSNALWVFSLSSMSARLACETLRQWISASPVRLELIIAGAQPMAQSPSHAKMKCGEF